MSFMDSYGYRLLFIAFFAFWGLDVTDGLTCFQCHGTSVSDVTSSCWETVNSEHARFVSLVDCAEGASCSLTVLNHTSIGLRDFTRACEINCKDSCFNTPFGTKLCKYCCTTDRCNAILPQYNHEKYKNTSEPSGANLKKWLQDLFSKIRHHTSGPSIKFHMRHEILKLMKEFIPQVQKQELSVSEVYEEDRAPENFRSFIRTTSLGFNLIGISPGRAYKTDRDEIIIIMAHYDTHTGSPGVNDNGSGMSVMLELARLLDAESSPRKNTIIFVATDFKEHGIYRTTSAASNQSECIRHGSYIHNVGSTNFVCHWLLPHLRTYGGNLSVAINLDTVMNVVERTKKKERWPSDFVRMLNSYRPYGVSFLDAARRKSFAPTWWMVKASTTAFERIFDTISPSQPNLKDDDFLYLQMNTSEQRVRVDEIRNLLHVDDCAPFHEIQNIELPCLTISDTGKYRGYMTRCHHAECDSLIEVDDRRIDSMVKLTTALVNAVKDLGKLEVNPIEQQVTESIRLEQPEQTVSSCDMPLIRKNRNRNDVFVSATCSRSGTAFEMCPTLGGGVWAALNGNTAWIPQKTRLGKAPLWLQVDFTEIVNITAIAIQGIRRKGYVRSYMASYSDNERNWKWHIPQVAQWEEASRRVEFRGNKDARKISKQSILPIISARFIRIFPRWWRRRIAMRVQIYGCRLHA